LAAQSNRFARSQIDLNIPLTGHLAEQARTVSTGALASGKGAVYPFASLLFREAGAAK
jgi:hypothetical protein